MKILNCGQKCFCRISFYVVCLAFTWADCLIAAGGDFFWDYEGNVIVGYQNDRDFQVVSGNGGSAIVAWTKIVEFASSKVYANLVDVDGINVWGAGGVQVSQSDNTQPPSMAPGDLGGAVIGWNASGNIYVQKINSSGVRQWNSGLDLLVGTGAGTESPTVCSDGVGGCFVGFNRRLAYVNREGVVSAPGVNGIELFQYTVGSNILRYVMISDNTGGFVFVPGQGLVPQPGGIFAAAYGPNSQLVYAQKLKNGSTWGPLGLTVSNQYASPYISLALDGQDGFVVSWMGFNATASPANVQLRAQRLNTAGNLLWSSNGVVVVDSAVVGGSLSSWVDEQGDFDSCTGGNGGAIIAWKDMRNISTPGDIDVFAQRLSASGSPLWAANGILLAPIVEDQRAPGSQAKPSVVSDGEGGAIAAYQDVQTTKWDLSATHISSFGKKIWSKYIRMEVPPDTPQDQLFPKVVYSPYLSPPNGAIVTWKEYDEHGDIAGQRVEIYLPEYKGDLDADGTSDGADLVRFIGDFAKTNCLGNCFADLDGDNDVDLLDLQLFAADFGKT